MNKEVDAYIAQSADFAKPILSRLRYLIHEVCPYVEETIKWGHPHFEYKGLMCNMAAFKSYCAFGFWKAALMENAIELKENNADAVAHSGKIKRLADLPPDKIIMDRIKEAMKLNEDDINLPERKASDKKPAIIVPFILGKELVKHKKASDTFNNLSPYHKREYIQWIEEAKTEEAKKKRILTTTEWLTEGKTRNWKYVKK
ncbi:MAG: DUF1801 domain-containing protein [Ginsengibacter sp.]